MDRKKSIIKTVQKTYFPKKTHNVVVLLIDDQEIISLAVTKLLKDEQDINLHYCQDPSNFIQIANEVQPTVILLDLVMPDIDGLALLRYIRANEKTRNVPVVVLSGREEAKTKADSFSQGANDYLVKLPNKVELIARIRYHSSAYIRLLERNQAYDKLDTELAEAAAYVRSLLPDPISNPLTSWQYIPSAQLGGDSFGYYWLDDDHFVFFLFDVCGHGVSAALLSISLMDALRLKTLPNTNFYDPANVLETLNKTFKMEQHNNMFITAWYGVYNKKNKQLKYSSGGHPPGLLIKGDSHHIDVKELTTYGLIIGCSKDYKHKCNTIEIPEKSKLYIYSDGVYEIEKQNGTMMQYEEYLTILKTMTKEGLDDTENIRKRIQEVTGTEFFPDDFCLLQIQFL